LQHFLLVDLGGSGLKAMLCGRDGEAVVSSHVANQFDEDGQGCSEQDPEDWWRAFGQVTDDLFKQAPREFEQIAAITICGFTRSQVFLSSQGQILRPALTFRDRRADGVSQQILSQSEVGKHRSAHHLNPFHPLVRLLWLKENEPDHWHELAHVLEPKDYLNFRLTGEIFSDPISQFWLLDAMKSQGKLKSLWHLVGLGKGTFMPPLRQPNQTIGYVRPGLPASLGRLQAVPVFCGAPDTWTAAAGLGAVKPACGYGISGSSEVFGLISSTYAEAKGLITIPWGDDLWQIGGPGQNGANIVDWCVQQFDKSSRPLEEKLGNILERQSHQPLLFYPFLDGERTPFWDGNLRAAFLGLSGIHQPGDQLRAVMEGVAFVNRIILDRAEAANGQKVTEIRFAGGGSKNPLWNQIRADILNRPILVAKTHEMGLRGALAIAQSGLGLIEGKMAAVESMRENFDYYMPQPRHVALYDALYKLFISNLPMIKDVAHGLKEISVMMKQEGRATL